MHKLTTLCAVLGALATLSTATARPATFVLSPSYSASTTLSSNGLAAEVERFGTGLIRYSFNRGIPGAFTPAGGCTVYLTAAEADHLGLVFQWSVSDVAPQAYEKRVPYVHGDGTWATPEIVTNRGWTSLWSESYVIDGHSPTTLYESSCFVVLTDEEALLIGGFLMEAAAVAP